MRALLTRLFERCNAKAERSAAGTTLPAGLDPNERRRPTARERSLMRRRLRALELDDGAEPEIEALRRALGERRTLDELLSSGAVVRCPGCGELAGRRERACANCGTRLASEEATERHAVSAQNGHAAAPASGAVRGASGVRSPTQRAR